MTTALVYHNERIIEKLEWVLRQIECDMFTCPDEFFGMLSEERQEVLWDLSDLGSLN
jgi:hypothetical protein